MPEKADETRLQPVEPETTPGAMGAAEAPREPKGAPEDEPTVVLRKRARSRPVPMSMSTKPNGITAVLTVLEGRHQGAIFSLRQGTNLIGRGHGVDLHLDDRGVSRQHARLVIGADGTADLVDLDSTNGTFVNGGRVTCDSLHVGDRIRVGLEAVLELSHVPSDQPAEAREPDAPTPRRRILRPVEDGADEEPNGSLRPGPSTPCWGKSEAAIGAYGRLLEIRRRRMGDNHASVAEILETMGAAFQDNGAHEPAIEYLSQALDIYEMHAPPMPRAVARTLTQLAHCELALGRSQVAVIRLERAEQILLSSPIEPVELGCVRLALARALWSVGSDKNRCMALARLACDTFAGGGATTQLLHRDARAWLRSMETKHVSEHRV